MFDVESPIIKRLFVITGAAVDIAAIGKLIFNLTKQKAPPWWAILLLVGGVVLILVSKAPPGDFSIKRREIIVDIKRWDGPGSDAMTSYRVDQIRCRRLRPRYLIYDEWAATGQRTSTDVVNFPFREEATGVNPTVVDLKIDLGTGCRYGKKYCVVCRCEYSNTFPDPQSEYYELKVGYPTKVLKITVLLPANKLCSDAWVTKRMGATTETESMRPEISENKRVIIWQKKKPDFNAKYRISWNW